MAVNFPKLDLQVPTAAGAASSSGPAMATSGGGGDSANAGGEQQGTISWQTTLPLGFTLRLDQHSKTQQIHVAALASGAESEEEPSDATYHLAAVISSIRDTPRGSEHLVVHVRNPDIGDNGAGWLLFNDFLVQPVSEESVLGLNDWWRAPIVALYANADRQGLADALAAIVKQYPYKISTRILTHPG
ncbi:poly(A)-specific ribonuclease, partial [Coemansia sp. RSA 1933]